MVEARKKEDETLGQRSVDWVRDWIPGDISNGKVLIVGAGTGAETVSFSKGASHVTALEPSTDACSIIEDKVEYYDIRNVTVDCGFAEELKYNDGEFDLVVCITVLEHTQNPMKCIDEMVRVLKSKKWMLLVTPEYFGLHEQHYKRNLPLFLPKFFIKMYLKYLGRPYKFIDTLQFVTYKMLRDKFCKMPVNAFFRHYPWPEGWVNGSFKMGHQSYLFGKFFKTQRDQYWLIQKI